MQTERNCVEVILVHSSAIKENAERDEYRFWASAYNAALRDSMNDVADRLDRWWAFPGAVLRASNTESPVEATALVRI